MMKQTVPSTPRISPRSVCVIKIWGEKNHWMASLFLHPDFPGEEKMMIFSSYPPNLFLRPPLLLMYIKKTFLSSDTTLASPNSWLIFSLSYLLPEYTNHSPLTCLQKFPSWAYFHIHNFLSLLNFNMSSLFSLTLDILELPGPVLLKGAS